MLCEVTPEYGWSSKWDARQTPPCLHGRAFLPGNYTGESQTDAHTPWNTHTARALRLKQLKCDFVHLRGKYTHKHKRPPTHFDWHDLVTADYTLRQRHECSANLCYPPTEGMAGTTAAQEGGCISPHALEGAERCISCQAASNHALPRVLRWQ